MTKETVENLNETYKTFLENRRAVLRRTKQPDNVIGEIRGYLKALKDCGVISDTEFRVLFTYYTLR